MTSQTYSPIASARGAAVYSQPASAKRVLLATTFDIGFVAAIELFVAAARGISPVPSLPKFAAMLLAGLAYWVILRATLGTTLGQRLWDLQPDRSRMRLGFLPSLHQRVAISSSTLGVGSFLTLSIFAFALAGAYFAVARHPLGAVAATEHWDAFLPPLSASGEAIDQSPNSGTPGELWSVYPFYYSLGAWPRTYHGKDVFYYLPYEKGPPERFIGRIEARWATPDTKVWIEGPKTPLTPDRYPYDRAEIRQCVTALWSLPLGSMFHCLKIRDAVLSRHLDSLKQASFTNFSVRWMEVSNPALPAQEQTQGIYLSATNDKRGQDRFILITSAGTNQVFLLSYPLDDARYAQETFQKAIRSLRVSDDLNPGRAWVDQGLEKVNLKELETIADPNLFERKLAGIQALLVSRASVEPKTYDTYFHLGGTSLMLARRAAKLKLLPQSDPLQSLGVDELAVAKPLIQNAYKYAQDVGPTEKRNTLLQSFWFESQKL